MLRKLLTTAFVLLFAASVTALGQNQDLKVGYMNPQEVLSQLPERAEIEQKLSSYIEERRSELSQKSTDFQQAVSTFQQNAASMSEQQQQQRQQELATQEQELRELQQSVQQQIQQRRSELMAPIYNRMDQAIATVAEANGLDFVLNETTGMGETIIFYSADQKLNITQQVLNRMNSDSN
ncbi:OmpH family outer membrane protein [Aliifodinibius sp. S!AR15-10]|uniref:OmpH family outer membrane protein n=1 Tax=Aliifodinibius sp. S!AR15-10 TaxID=2950437 RepID=UPI0028559C08|nr:OmpH family outer membrane protein [Aliifodinibius sp. S!AR15-10]MDR8389787.1 OmpH family outer membrane protein [Aliifodinibius sp. S!AR15-10]